MRENGLDSGNLKKDYIRFAVPTVLSLLVFSLYSMDEQLQKLCDWVDAHREEIAADVLESVKNYSPSEDRGAVSKSLDWFAKKAASFGFENQLRANGEVLSVWKGNQDKCVGLIAHADVVPIGDIHQWSHDPRGERTDGKIYGRGVLDDKGMSKMLSIPRKL